MREKVKQILSAMVVCCFIVIGILYFSEVTENKDADFKYGPFFEDDTEYDVLFFGSSHVLNAIFPMQLWNDYGITSYNFGGHANTIGASYWVYKNAIEYHKPKIAVLDVLGAGAQSADMHVGFAHVSFDAFPYSKLKKEAVKDIFADEQHQKQLLYPFSIFHSRWHMLDDIDYAYFLDSPEYGKEKGAESRIAVAIPRDVSVIDKNEKETQETEGKEYIRKFIQSCREEGIEPVLMFVPFPATAKEQMWANSVYDIAEEENVRFFNMQQEEIVDFDIDCYDFNSHLNTSGARKVTDYLGACLKQQYGLSDKRLQEDFQTWNEDYEEYRQMLFINIQKEKDLKNTLMLLNNSNFKADIRCNLKCEFDEITNKLLEQVDASVKWEEEVVPDSESDVFIKVFDVKTNDIVDMKEFSYDFMNAMNGEKQE